jgi:hypothetical protein
MTSVGRAGSRLRLAIFLVVFALSALAASHRGASAEASYPNKSVRIVLPFAAGGVADTTARIDSYSSMKQVPGAGVIGARALEKHAGHCHVARKRRCQLRGRLLERAVCARRHAARDRQQAQWRIAGDTRRRRR